MIVNNSMDNHGQIGNKTTDNSTVDQAEAKSAKQEFATVVLQLESCPPRKKRSVNGSPVWKHFCQNNTKTEETNFEDHTVYCIHCLKNNMITRYREGTSTTSLRHHLTSKHGLNPEEVPRPELQLSSLELIEKIACIEYEAPDECVKPKRAKKTNNYAYKSKVRRFYCWINNGENCVCLLCAKQGVDHIYTASTSTTTMKRHLIQFHKCDPNIDDNQLPDSTPIDLPVELWELVTEKTKIITGRVGSYFITLPGEIDSLFCCFCLKENLKQIYSSSTGLTNLRNHLIKRHNYVGPKLDTNPESKLYRAELDTNLNEAIVKMAQKRANKPGLKPRQYFIRLDDDGEEIFCVFCLSEQIKYRYHENCGISNLRRHLEVQHKVCSFKRKYESNQNDDSIDEENFNYNEDSVDSQEITSEGKFQELQHHEPLPSLANSCRACGKLNQTFTTNIFGVLLDLDNSLQVPLTVALEQVTGIKAVPTDLKSQLICFICMASLKTAYQFQLNVQEIENISDNIVLQTLENDNIES